MSTLVPDQISTQAVKKWKESHPAGARAAGCSDSQDCSGEHVAGAGRFDQAVDHHVAALEMHQVGARILTAAADHAGIADRELAAGDDRDRPAAGACPNPGAGDRTHGLHDAVDVGGVRGRRTDLDCSARAGVRADGRAGLHVDVPVSERHGDIAAAGIAARDIAVDERAGLHHEVAVGDVERNAERRAERAGDELRVGQQMERLVQVDRSVHNVRRAGRHLALVMGDREKNPDHGPAQQPAVVRHRARRAEQHETRDDRCEKRSDAFHDRTPKNLYDFIVKARNVRGVGWIFYFGRNHASCRGRVRILISAPTIATRIFRVSAVRDLPMS